MSPAVNRGGNGSKPSPEMLVRRAFNYSLLAAALNDPDEAGIAELQALVAAGGDLAAGTSLAGVAALAAYADPEVLVPEYTRIFSLSSSQDCPTFETAFACSQPAEQTSLMADVAGFYRAFGVDSSRSDTRPDDLSVELEFMSYLCRKDAYALDHSGPPRVAQVRKAQRLFFENHIGTWAGVIGRKLSGIAAPGIFHATAGATLEAWSAMEAEALGVTPVQVSGHAAQWLAPASHGPEFAGGGNFVPVAELAVR